MDDARPFVPDNATTDNEDMLILDSYDRIVFSDKAIQLGFMLCVFCTKGTASFRINSKMYTMLPGDFLINVGEQIFEERKISKDFEGKTIIVSHRFMQDSLLGLHHLWPYLLYVLENPLLHLNRREQEWVIDSYAQIAKRMRNIQHRYHRETIMSLLRVFYFDVCDLLARRCTQKTDKQIRSYDIFDRFIRLTGENFKRERNVTWYSEQLCLTPKYLSEVIKSVSGRTAGQWITNLVIMEIKMLLRSTPMSIKEIAHEMNFPNQSFLGKYFKNITGLSPSDFRHG